MANHFDICIIGAGPAGIINAIELAKLGYKIALIEKQSFPQFNIGCNLSLITINWLKQLNLYSIIEESILHFNNKIQMHWQEFEPISKDDNSIVVDRAKFDLLLLNHAIKMGISYYQTLKNTKIIHRDILDWEIINDAINQPINCKFLVEAIGRNTAIIKSKKTSYLPNLIATYAFIDNHYQESILEANKASWLYYLPYSNKGLLTIYSSADLTKRYNSIDSFFNSITHDSKFFNSKKIATNQIKICNATAYLDENAIANDYIKIGDAAYTTDPITAQGVCKAIRSAIQAKFVIHTILSLNSNSQLAIDFYKNNLNYEIIDSKNKIINTYKSQNLYTSDFWQQYHQITSTIVPNAPLKAIDKEDILKINPLVKFINNPILSEEFIMETNAIQIADEQPFAYLGEIPIVSLLQHINQKSPLQIMEILHKDYKCANPSKILAYLVDNNIMSI